MGSLAKTDEELISENAQMLTVALSYLLLDYICAAMIDHEDPICESIEEQMNEMGLDSAWRPADNPDLPKTRVEMMATEWGVDATEYR